ncbi:unnamed protein product [Clonostachys solani]|uniref:Uncharacterized protein n=1 Tax=Clonostachys solani TaxID=160281 RepID=A0A9N9YWI5_9HYPO|nr:unnamed protein product [Clonostachys solani]
MADINSTAIREYGFSCPSGGHVHICERAKVEFIGCCASDPCAGDEGICPDDHLRPMSYLTTRQFGYLPLKCVDTSKKAKFQTCWGIYPGLTFVGCCETTLYGGDTGTYSCNCAQQSLAPMMLDEGSRKIIFNLETETSQDSGNIGLKLDNWEQTPSTSAMLSWGNLRNADVGGLAIGAVLFLILLPAVFLKVMWKARKLNLQEVTPDTTECFFSAPDCTSVHGIKVDQDPESCQVIAIPTEETAVNPASDTWPSSPQKLHPRTCIWYLEWAWEILLTLLPIFFIVLCILALLLDGRPLSNHGQAVLDIARLIPTAYPIVFAAIASRFYKGLARWYIERPNGVNLAVLEQVLGSQSFAGALERLLFVRTQVQIGAIILIIWAMSPLGGQAGLRMVSSSKGSSKIAGSIWYLQPGAHQSSFGLLEIEGATRGHIFALYSSGLLSSSKQRRSPSDLWDLPKVPQWTAASNESSFREIDTDALVNGEADYVSLLGTKVQGLEVTASNVFYNFLITTPYIDLNCSAYTGMSFEANPYQSILHSLGMSANLNGSSFRANLGDRDQPYLLFASLDYSNAYFALFTCFMQLVTVETEMQCAPSNSSANCSAKRQRLLKSSEKVENLYGPSDEMRKALKLWQYADGSSAVYSASPTDSYLAGHVSPYAGHNLIKWSEVDVGNYSRRLTTLFNTYMSASINPMGHTDVSFSKSGKNDPSPSGAILKTTAANATIVFDVYETNRTWVGVALTATLLLQLLAVLGLMLRFLVKGPDILGFASSMTRDNPYVNLPEGGSGLDGPDRARLLRGTRIQLADVRPEQEIGYITLRAVEPKYSTDGVKGYKVMDNWRPFTRGRLYT